MRRRTDQPPRADECGRSVQAWRSAGGGWGSRRGGGVHSPDSASDASLARRGLRSATTPPTATINTTKFPTEPWSTQHPAATTESTQHPAAATESTQRTAGTN